MKHPRLPGFDYRQPNAFFITINAYHRLDLFGSIRRKRLTNNFLGTYIHTDWANLPAHQPFMLIDTYIVMPNHMHAILWTTKQYDDVVIEQFGQPVPGSVPTAIRSFKTAATDYAHEQGLTTLESIWQRGYWLEVIESERHLYAVRRYIETNPQRPYR